MLDLYTWAAPNGQKIQILVEELGIPYTVRPVDITRGAQFAPEYLVLNPNNRIPTIVDHDPPSGFPRPHTVFESGAILVYLAEKHGRFLPADPGGRSVALQWLMWLTAGLGPMFGQLQHFHRYAPERQEYALERYRKECYRLLDVMERRLTDHDYLAGEYSIADIACFPWLRLRKYGGLDPDRHSAINRWYAAIRARPAVGRGLAILTAEWVDIAKSDEAKANLFGARQYEPK